MPETNPATSSLTLLGGVTVTDGVDTMLVNADGSINVTVSGLTNTQYTEDAAAAANPVGTAVNLIRQDTPATLVSTDGDNVAQRGTNYGAGYVQVVTSAGAFVDTFGGGTQYAVDAALGATPTGTLAIAIRDDALSALTPVEGDAIGLRVDANGALWTHDDALDAALAGSEIQVDVVAALPAGTNNIGDVDVLTIAAGDNNIGNVDIVTVPAPLSTTGGGTEATALRVTVANDSTGVLSVDDNGGNLSVDWAGTAPPIGAGVEATALRVTVATDSTGVLSVDDNGGSLTIDNAALTTADLDLGVGTDTRGVIGIVGSKSGGAQIIPGDATAGLKVDLGVDNDVTVTGTVTANLAAGTNNIGDVDVLSIAAGDNNIGNVDLASAIPAGTNVIGVVVPDGHATAGVGLSTLFDASVDNTAQALKASAGRLYFLEVSNPTAADAYLQIFDLATGSVTVGTTTPKLSLIVPAGDGTLDGAMDKVWVAGLHFATAITYAATTTATGGTGPSTALVLNAGFV